ncbi:MAG: hypothetical protein M0D55_07125 [Elusimicrobiota bacterium]|nr:MAG: hypothetical protein M0D55_07125 [Elusimicrobiota bacterium]
MNWLAHAVGAFGGTVAMTILISGSRGMGLTRMDIPFMLGTMLTPDRDKARWVGVVVNLVNGWLFAWIYFAAFALHRGIWSYPLFGAAIGLAHSLFVLTAGMSLLPSLHPRMATEQCGPGVKRLLEPPGFMALNYGAGTPIVTVLAHLAYGAFLGWCFSA